MKSRLHILHLEDDPGDAVLVRETLEADGAVCHITRVEAEESFKAALEQHEFDLILADYTLPSFDGLRALTLARRVRPHVPFIFVSGTLGEEVAIEALRIGATDYVFKNRLSRITPAVQRALREAEERAERSRAEQALRRSEAYLAEGQRLSQAGSFGWNLSTGDIYWSRETFRIFECDDAASGSIELTLQRTHPDDRAAVHDVIERAAHDRLDIDYEHRLLFPDGRIKHVHVIARPVSDESGGPGYIGAIQDITQSRRAEEELRDAQAELARVARLTTMGEFTASMAHEINQPLTAIANNGSAGLRWLNRETPDLVEAHNAFKRIVQDAVRAGNVIRGIRGLATKSGPQLIRLDVDDVIAEVLSLTRSEVFRHSVTLRVDLCLDGRLALGDKVQLQQVLLNLIMNGIDAMKDVTGRPRELIVSSEIADPSNLLVSVEDTGAGLHPDTAPRVFEPFFTTKEDGLGMGLPICRSIIDAHGGRLWLTPRTPHGTAVRFTVPVAPEL